jgi:hypothetical protein
VHTGRLQMSADCSHHPLTIETPTVVAATRVIRYIYECGFSLAVLSVTCSPPVRWMLDCSTGTALSTQKLKHKTKNKWNENLFFCYLSFFFNAATAIQQTLLSNRNDLNECRYFVILNRTKTFNVLYQVEHDLCLHSSNQRINDQQALFLKALNN